MENLLVNCEISVSESEKRANGALNLRDFHTVFLIEVRVTNSQLIEDRNLVKLSTVWRRYTEFEQLKNYLSSTYPFVVIPPLPEKRVMFNWQKSRSDTFDPSFIDRRRAGLENFLLRVAAHQLLSWDETYIKFLQNQESWNENLCKYQSNLKILVSIKLKKNKGEFESLWNYGGNLRENLTTLMKSRSRLAEKRFNLYKLHSNYGKLFSEWSIIEKELGDSLQKTGHFFDSISSSIDATLEEEEILMDQLKEYLFVADSIQKLCSNYEYLQSKVEESQEYVCCKNIERQKAQNGRISLISKLFGFIDTEELRELKINNLDQQIRDSLSIVEKNKKELEEFTEKAQCNVEMFEKQKNVDLKDILNGFAVLHLKTAKKDLQTWKQIRDCLLNSS